MHPHFEVITKKAPHWGAKHPSMELSLAIFKVRQTPNDQVVTSLDMYLIVIIHFLLFTQYIVTQITIGGELMRNIQCSNTHIQKWEKMQKKKRFKKI